MTSVSVDHNTLSIATEWLGRLNSAAISPNVAEFSGTFLSTGWMRDLLCFSWDFRSLQGQDKLTDFLSEIVEGQTRLSRAGLHDFRIQTTSTLGPPSSFPLPLNPESTGVQAIFEFALSSPPARGRGFVRLVQDFDSKYRAIMVLFSLEDIEGHEEPNVRPTGSFPDDLTWEEVRAQRRAAIEQNPTVLIIGGGQAGLMCAARLGGMVISALVIEREERIGNVWRKRYPNLSLHTSAHYCTMLYHPWPTTFPKYIPKEKVADFLEAYAVSQDLVTWVSSEVLPTPVYDSATAHWSVHVNRAGKTITLSPKHIIMATGNGKPNIPVIPGMKSFGGPLYHSNEHRGAAPFKGKKAVVVGAGNAAADICIDFVRKGAESVTMVQRSATCVMAMSTADKILYDLTFNERFAIEDADFAHASLPMAFILQLGASGGAQQEKALDRKLLDGLAKTNFKLMWELTPGGGEVGILGFVFERTGSGSMLDRGCGQLIIDGKVKVINSGIDHFDHDHLVFDDATRLDADVVVLATGNQPIINDAQAIFGPSIVDKVGPQIAGLDGEGEYKLCYGPTGQGGLWFVSGLFGHSRFFSKCLALQILADELGLK